MRFTDKETKLKEHKMKTSTCILTALLISSIAMAQSNYGKIPVDISGSSVDANVTNNPLVELVNGDGLVLKQDTTYSRTIISGASANIIQFSAGWIEMTDKD